MDRICCPCAPHRPSKHIDLPKTFADSEKVNKLQRIGCWKVSVPKAELPVETLLVLSSCQVDAAASKATPNSNPDGITADGVGSAFRDSPSRQSPDAAALQAASSSAEQGTRQDKSSAKKKVQSMIVPGAGAVILWKEKRGMNRPNSAGSEQIPEGENTPVSSGPGASNENGGGHVSKIAVGRKRRRNEVPERVLKEIEGNVEVNLQGVPSSKKGETCQVEAQVNRLTLQ